MNKHREFYFGKREVQLIKGIAIISMFYHHFFGFPSWLAPEIDFIRTYIAGKCIEQGIASFGKICVGIFAFTSGYALFVQNESERSLKSIIKKAAIFLGNYWSIFLIFIIFGLFFKEPFPPVNRLLLQCFGISTATGFNWDYFNAIHPVFAWYVSFYLLFIFLSPFLMKLCKKGFFRDLLLISVILFGGCFLSVSLLPDTPYSIIKILIKSFSTWGHIGMIGFLFAKYNIFSRINNVLIKRINPAMLIFILIIVISAMLCLWSVVGIHYIYASDNMRISILSVFTPIFIYSVIHILNSINCKWIESTLSNLSKESTNMWLLHGIFFTPKKTLQWIAYLPKHPVLILIWTLVLMYCFSKIIRFTSSSIIKLVKKKKRVVSNDNHP